MLKKMWCRLTRYLIDSPEMGWQMWGFIQGDMYQKGYHGDIAALSCTVKPVPIPAPTEDDGKPQPIPILEEGDGGARPL
jgi:hypothetical protein